MTRSEFALAVMKAVYGADKDTDFLARGQADGLLPQGLTLDATVMPRGEASLLLYTALTIITTMSTSNIHGHMPPLRPLRPRHRGGRCGRRHRGSDRRWQ